MMGAEPFIRALEQGADVVLAGRASDTAIFASVPLMRGFPAGLAWHAAKILECGAAAVVNRKSPDCMFVWLRHDHFLVAAPDPDLERTESERRHFRGREAARMFSRHAAQGQPDVVDEG